MTMSIPQIKRCQNCGNEEYQLVTNASPFFSETMLEQLFIRASDLLGDRVARSPGGLRTGWCLRPDREQLRGVSPEQASESTKAFVQ